MSPLLKKAISYINPLYHWSNTDLPKWVRIGVLFGIGAVYTIFPGDFDFLFPIGYADDAALDVLLFIYIIKIYKGETESPRDRKVLSLPPS